MAQKRYPLPRFFQIALWWSVNVNIGVITVVPATLWAFIS